ncbi:hypothetical protein M758_6G120200 [Ceratodon purpureus]|nr:hypothetical protein M758_6G120200 [Ceratodon purpureus]
MEKGNIRPEILRTRAGGQWTSAQCIQKVEEMISRAICQQEDLWGMLLIHSPGNVPFDDSIREANGEESISPLLLKALKVKLENSMDWCHLALCRLKEIISHSSSFPSPADSSEITGLSPSPSSSTRLKVPSPLSALRVPLSKEPLSSYPFTNTGRLQNEWSPGSFLFFNEASQSMPSRAQTCDGEQLQESASLIVPDGEQQGHRFLRLPSLGLDSDWNMLAEAQVSDLPASLSPRGAPGAAPTEAHQSSSSCQFNLPDASDNGADNEDQSLVTKLNSRGLRPRCGPKRDREETDEKNATVSVVFQELKPGDDTKKGIPDDGHRGWKKYGNKTIQNSNFCRGYYKCSMKDCRAKKMVQPTDKNPTIFEVTYVGSHTCSSTSRRRHRSRATSKTTTAPTNLSPPDQDTRRPAPPLPGAGDILVQTKIARLLKNQATCSTSMTEAAETTTSTQPKSNDLGSAENRTTCEDQLEGKSWHENHELSDVINDSKEVAEDCSADQENFDQTENLYLDQISSRDEEELGFHSFQSDSLLWQEILSSSHREGWNDHELQVEI